MIIFCDGVFDWFHHGHVNHFKNIKELYPDSFLLVGVLNDLEASSYKRKSHFNEEKRLFSQYKIGFLPESLMDLSPAKCTVMSGLKLLNTESNFLFFLAKSNSLKINWSENN